MADGHRCHATGCSVPVPPEKLMCRRHWFTVSKGTRDAVWFAYRAGQCEDMNPSAAYCEAARAAIIEVARKEGRIPDTRLYDLFLARKEQPA